jgi:hypothetical protein
MYAHNSFNQAPPPVNHSVKITFYINYFVHAAESPAVKSQKKIN